MTRCSRNTECPESSRADVPVIVENLVDPPPVANAANEVTDRHILNMERMVRELTHKNLELQQNFNRRTHELEDTNAQLQARILEQKGSKLTR